jgi:signal transduction histidine kinase
MAPGTVAASAAEEAGLLGELLHALNQPLTGLQCSLEVALAVEQTPQEYRRFMREGLELTGRMRALVEALREVAEMEREPPCRERAEEKAQDTLELGGRLREVMEDLRPVAESNQIRLTGNWDSACRAEVRLGLSASGMTSWLFRLLDSILGLAAAGGEMEVTLRRSSTAQEVILEAAWTGAEAGSEYSRPQLALIMARARVERSGGRWSRLRAGGRERVTVILPDATAGAG